MKYIFTFLFLAIFSVWSQENKTVTLIVSAQGKTKEDAKQNALRSAIEQAFGAFISSKTEILNDNLVRDEVISVSNGNIQEFIVLSEMQLPDGTFSSTVKATVSVSKLTSFCQNKGVQIEFPGSLFAMNAILDNLNKESEIKAVQNLALVCSDILKKSKQYVLLTDEPKCKEDECLLNFTVTLKLNDNITLFENYFKSTLEELAMTQLEQETYMKNDRVLYPIAFGSIKSSGGLNIGECFYLRSKESIQIINNLLRKSNYGIHDFKIKSEAGEIIGWGIAEGLDFGFPAATSIYFEDYIKKEKGAFEYGNGPNLIEKGGILILSMNYKPNSAIGKITLQEKYTYSELGKISKFLIEPL